MKKQMLMLTLLLLSMLGAASAHADVTLGVTSSAARFSPGNWAGDAGRGGSQSRTTWNNGAWCQWRWSTTASNPSATLQIANPTLGSAVSYFLDGAFTDNVPVPSSGGIALAGLTGPGSHILTVYTRNSAQMSRWSDANAFTVTGLTVDTDAVPDKAQPRRPWVLIVGDSITEGIQANNGSDSNLSDYSFLVGAGLSEAGYDTSVSACGYSGWLRAGDAGGDVPAYYAVQGGGSQGAESRWNKIDARTSLLDSRGHLSAYGSVGQEPSLILINYGVNECLSHTSLRDMAVSVEGALLALRHAAPRAKIVVLVPPGLADTRIYPAGASYIAALKQAMLTYQSNHQTDRRTVLVDFGSDLARALGSPAYGGGVHPNAAGHAFLAPHILQALL
jgi:lysophospholipase L1-like esterase